MKKIKSKAQQTFFEDLKSGLTKNEKITPALAAEYLKNTPKNLPDRVKKVKK